MFMPSATTLIFSFILCFLHEEDAGGTNVSPVASPCDPLLMFPVGTRYVLVALLSLWEGLQAV